MKSPNPGGGRCRLVHTLASECGTDREILNGIHGSPPPGEQRLVLGHESLGTVMAAPSNPACCRATSWWASSAGPIRAVRRLRRGEWDMCRNGRYTERGIKERHGYGAERFRIEPEFAVKIDPDLGILGVLLEPASILAKAWDHAERIGRRARLAAADLARHWRGPDRVVGGADGDAARARGARARSQQRRPKEAIVRDLGGIYHSDGEPRAARARRVDGMHRAPAVISGCLGAAAAAGIVCLTGVTEPGRGLRSTSAASIALWSWTTPPCSAPSMPTADTTRWHARPLARADKSWLERLITRRVPLERWSEALEHRRAISRSSSISSRHVVSHRGLRPDRRLHDGRTGRARRLGRLAVLAALRLRCLLPGIAR